MILTASVKRDFAPAPATPAQARAVSQALKRLYQAPRSELNFQNEYQLIVCVMLSAQCTDKKVNEVTPTLFSRFPDFVRLSQAKLSAVRAVIRPINYYRTKAANLIRAAKLIVEEFSSALPRTHAELISLPGVGNKTANVVLGELGAAHTFPVDTHVFRVSRRLGLAAGKNVAMVEEELKRLFKSKDWRTLHHCLIFHGRRVCKARRPLCAQCALNKLCPSANVDGPVRGV